MSLSNEYEEVPPELVTLEEVFFGYQILVAGEHAGAIERTHGKLDGFVVKKHWREKGVGRAALQEFVVLSGDHGESEVMTNNVMHDAMEHILETECFESGDEMGRVKHLG